MQCPVSESAAPMPAGSGVAPLADVPDGEPGHGPPELVVRGKDPVVASIRLMIFGAILD